jgi:LAS superfamily LD-carboxypeptidase LdcB
VLFFSSILIISSFFFTIRQNEIAVVNYQKNLQEQTDLKLLQIKKERKIYLMGKFDQKQRDDFVYISKEYSAPYTNEMYLRKETFNAFLKMHNAAKKDKINLKIASATRNFNYQKSIWNDKWTGNRNVDGKNLFKSFPNELERFKKILEYSAVPGTSRHHWGSEIDINAATPEYFKTSEGKKVYEWLIKNAPSYGFCQPYTLRGTARPNGYNEEKWHWSYLPLAKAFTQQYKDLIVEKDINGFLGDEHVLGQDLINDYVLSINKDCI